MVSFKPKAKLQKMLCNVRLFLGFFFLLSVFQTDVLEHYD